jgi:hypothetical protein
MTENLSSVLVPTGATTPPDGTSWSWSIRRAGAGDQLQWLLGFHSLSSRIFKILIMYTVNLIILKAFLQKYNFGIFIFTDYHV